MSKTIYDWDDESEFENDGRFSEIIMASYKAGEIVDINKLAEGLEKNDPEEEDGR